MAKSGKARVLNDEQWSHLYEVIAKKRYPEKNRAIMQISQKLGLRAQEIALLQLKEVCRLQPRKKNSERDFELLEIMSLPAAYTKGSDAMNRSKAKYLENRSMTFKKMEFDRIVDQIVTLTKAGAEVDPSTFYPPLRKHKGKSRDLPMIDDDLRSSLTNYLALRLKKDPNAKATAPLFITQKGGAYSPNTLQEHMGHMLKNWASIEKASSHTGRRSLITYLIHEKKLPLAIAQKVAGHISPSTTVIYTEPTDQEITEALSKVK